MGGLRQAPFEVRLAATLFLLLLGIADLFGAWEVKNFAAFTPRAVAATVAAEREASPMPAMKMAGVNHAGMASTAEEHVVDLSTLDRPRHTISRDLLVQDTHVHIPAYALTAAALSLVVFGLRLSSRARSAVVLLAFAAPLADFVGLWGAHLFPAAALLFGTLTVAGGFAMGLAYLFVLVLTLAQCWLSRPREEDSHA
ncbi:MAG TPA: hypothetical protein VFE33_26595 [Thermoanaerobaculia bacterium]|nr:hypothetical protein [Thermoanaerobaculia bacterium]